VHGGLRWLRLEVVEVGGNDEASAVRMVDEDASAAHREDPDPNVPVAIEIPDHPTDESRRVGER
jgi:hypothetical protein